MSNFSYILSLLNQKTANRKNTDPLKMVCSNLDALNAQIQRLNTPEVNEHDEEEVRPEPHKMTPEEYDTLIQAYNTLITSIQSASAPDKKTRTQQYLEELTRMLNRDLEGLHRANRENLSDYHSMVDDTAHYTADISGKNLIGVGGASSNRISLSVADGKGGYVDGYFKADSRLNPETGVKEAFEDAIIACQDNKELCNALHNIFTEHSSLNEAGSWLFGEYHADFRDPGVTDQFSPHRKSAENLKKLSDMWNTRLGIYPKKVLTLGQMQSLYTLARRIHGLGFNRNFMEHTAHIEQGGVIGQRNAAMSAMADYLGVPDLIARSSQMSVLVGTKDGKPVYRNGTFMEKAPGVKPDDLIDHIDSSVKSVQTEGLAMKKAVANLQVLDYICGNVNRHRENYLVKSEVKNNKMVLTGLVGINNDAAFGEIDLDKDTNALYAPAHMGYITKDMAVKVSEMTPRKLQAILSGFGLRNREIAAAWNRVEALKKYIAEHEADFVKDDEAMKDVKLNDFYEASTAGRESSNPPGIGEICALTAASIKNLYHAKNRMLGFNTTLYIREYRESHQLDPNTFIPMEDYSKIEEKADYVSFKQVQDWYNVKTNKPELHDYYLKQAEKSLLERHNANHEEEPFNPSLGDLEIAGAMIRARVMESEFAKEYDQKLNLVDNAPEKEDIRDNAAAEAPEDNGADRKVNRMNDKAARLAEVQNKLEDVLASFEPTRREHGMTRACSKMYRSLNSLLAMTRALKENTLQDPGAYEEKSWNDFQKNLRETLDNTCYYISRKPLNPRHPYGKDRLDAARQLRSATLGALQMATDEMLPKQEIQKLKAANALNAQKQNGEIKENKGIQINDRS